MPRPRLEHPRFTGFWKKQHGLSRSARIVSIVFFSVGAFALLIAIASLIWNVTWLARTLVAEGQVTGFIARGGPGTGERISHFPVVSFTAADGRRVQFEGSSGANPPAYRQGEAVRVRYFPDAPQAAYVSGFLSLWVVPILFGVMGAMFTFGGVMARIGLVRKRR